MAIKIQCKSDDVIVRPAWDIREIEGYSGCFCRCGAVLHIKTPKIKAFHNVACPECGFVVQLFCGQE